MFTLSNFFGFGGKSGQKNYILSLIVLILAGIVASWGLAQLGVGYDIRRALKQGFNWGLLVNIIFIWSFLALTVKRGREIGVHPVISLILGFFLNLITAIVYCILPARTFK